MHRKHISAYNDFPHELLLLTKLLHPMKNDALDAEIRSLLQYNIRWKRFEELARIHKVMPLAYRRLSELNDALPHDIKQHLRAETEIQSKNILDIISELIRLDTELHRNNINYFVLKGPVMAQQIYGDYSVRPAVDIDVFMTYADTLKFFGLSSQCGYVRKKPRHTIGKFISKIAYFLQKDQTFSNRHKKQKFEVHYGILYNNNSYKQQFDFYTNNPETIPIGGKEFHTINSEKLLLYLATHGAYHQFFRLFWLLDIAWILEQKKAVIRWDELLSLAETFDMKRILTHAVILSSIVFGTHIPPEIQIVADNDTYVYKLVKFSLEAIRGNYNNSFSQKLRLVVIRARFHTRVKNQMRWYIFFVLRTVCSPLLS